LHEIEEKIAEDEILKLLFYDKPPVELPREEFKNLIGHAKYKAFLNFTYGVLVEESLIYAVVDEVRKDKRSVGANEDEGVMEGVFRRIYGSTEEHLLAMYKQEKGYKRRKNIYISELSEYYYWLFKYRLKYSDSSRVASDTKKALQRLQNIMTRKRKAI
jgi:hypothetical protein